MNLVFQYVLQNVSPTTCICWQMLISAPRGGGGGYVFGSIYLSARLSAHKITDIKIKLRMDSDH